MGCWFVNFSWRSVGIDIGGSGIDGGIGEGGMFFVVLFFLGDGCLDVFEVWFFLFFRLRGVGWGGGWKELCWFEEGDCVGGWFVDFCLFIGGVDNVFLFRFGCVWKVGCVFFVFCWVFKLFICGNLWWLVIVVWLMVLVIFVFNGWFVSLCFGMVVIGRDLGVVVSFCILEVDSFFMLLFGLFVFVFDWFCVLGMVMVVWFRILGFVLWLFFLEEDSFVEGLILFWFFFEGFGVGIFFVGFVVVCL